MWLTTIALLILIATTVSLGNWQMRRADEKRRLADAQAQALNDSPIDIGAATADARALDGRRIRAVGRFDPAGTIFLDNRTHKGRAGFHVLTPLRLASGGSALLVLRGWVPREADLASRVPQIDTPAQTVEIDGWAVAELPQALQLEAPHLPPRDQRIWQYFNLTFYAQWWGEPVRPLLLRQTSPLDDRLIREWVQPGASIDKNLSYALQWYSMAAALVCFGSVAIWRLRRGRTGSVTSKDLS